MQDDDLICYCYRVPLRKLLSFARRERLAHPSQMSECLNAGTGCGWCIPYLEEIAAAGQEGRAARLPTDPAAYSAARQRYRTTGRREEEPGETPPCPPSA